MAEVLVEDGGAEAQRRRRLRGDSEGEEGAEAGEVGAAEVEVVGAEHDVIPVGLGPARELAGLFSGLRIQADAESECPRS